MNAAISTPGDGLSLSFRPKKEEKLPLTGPPNQHRGYCGPFGQMFNVIVLCMALFTVALTIALVVDIVAHKYQVPHRHGALVTESNRCGFIGVEILKEGGSAVDVAVAVQLCLGVVLPHLTGIGGGGLMSIYRNGDKMEATTIDFRETAPVNVGLSTSGDKEASTRIAVPGLLRGLALAHRLYGKLPWQRLVEPSAALAAAGFRVGDSLRRAIENGRLGKLSSPLFKEVFLPNGTVPGADGWIRWQTLSKTLLVIAKDGPDVFYNGSLANSIVQDLTEAGVTLTAEDFRNYSAKLLPPLEVSFRGLQLLSPPSIGPSLLSIMKLMEALWDSLQEMTAELRYDTLIQVIKVASAAVAESGRRGPTWSMNRTLDDLLGDENIKQLVSDYFAANRSRIGPGEAVEILPPDAAASVVVSDSEELFVAAVTGLGSTFGSGMLTSSGIFMNDAYKHGCAVPVCERPSTMLPVILREKDAPCGTLLAAASADYQMLAQMIAQLDRSLPIKNAMTKPRLRVFDEVQGDVGIDGEDSGWNGHLLDDLQKRGHTIFRAQDIISSVGAVRSLGDLTEAYTDSKLEKFHVVI